MRECYITRGSTTCLMKQSHVCLKRVESIEVGMVSGHKTLLMLQSYTHLRS